MRRSLRLMVDLVVEQIKRGIDLHGNSRLRGRGLGDASAANVENPMCPSASDVDSKVVKLT